MVYQDGRPKQQNIYIKKKIGVRIRVGQRQSAGCSTLHSVCGEALRPGSWVRRFGWKGTRGVSGFTASLRYFFGAGSSCGCSCGAVPSYSGTFCVCAGYAGLCLLGHGGLFLLQAAPACLVQPHVAEHGLGQTCVWKTGPLCKQWLCHVSNKAWKARKRGRLGLIYNAGFE